MKVPSRNRKLEIKKVEGRKIWFGYFGTNILYCSKLFQGFGTNFSIVPSCAKGLELILSIVPSGSKFLELFRPKEKNYC